MTTRTRLASAFVIMIAIVPNIIYGGELGQALVENYRVAHEAKDIEAMKALVNWEGGTKRTHEIIEQRLFLYLNLVIKNIEFRPLTGGEEFESLNYVPNLEPVGWLAIVFEPQNADSRYLGKSFVVGEMNGKYFITVAKPVK